MNVAGISSAQEGPKFDFVFLCHQEYAAEFSSFGAINESPFKSQGQMLLSSCGWTSRVHPVPHPGEQGCVRFRTEVLLSGLSLHSGLIYSFICIMPTSVWICVQSVGNNKDLWWSEVLPNVKELSFRLHLILSLQLRKKLACVEGCS